MYNCLINIILKECTNGESEIFSSVTLPEDCELNFHENCSSHSLEKTPDTAYIFGNAEAYIAGRDNTDGCYCAVITDGMSVPDGFDGGKADIWVIPAESGCRDELLKLYFSSFVKKIKDGFDFRHLNICFETATDSVPDLIWFKDMRGAHLMTNDSFCQVVGKTKEQIYKKGHYYIWDIPKEEYEQGDYVCLESEEVVINAGKTCLFDEKVKTKSGMRQFKTYKSPLYDTDGRLFGTCGVARDVTDLHKINSELEVVLESVPFGIMLEDNNETLVSANAALEKYFPDIKEYEGKNCVEWKTKVMGEAEDSGMNEFTVHLDRIPSILRFSKEPIMDIFGEIIGRVIIFQDMTAERVLQKKTMEHANTDFLTGLNNRRSLFLHLDEVKNSPQLSMITVDLDNFKKVNDTCGHKMGDNVLVETASMLTSCFKSDFVSRLGGDEFLVVVSRDVSREQLEAETQDFIDIFGARFAEKSDLAVMTVSAGISMGIIPENGVHNAEALMYSSDCALYEAKKEGKSRYCFYED